MGIRGLTTYISRRSDKYFERYELHDTYLVIDGNNIASHLYKWYSKCNDCFGGDYNKYARVVYNFFHLLSTCNIIPLIIFDGAYEDKKLKTVCSRLRSKIKLIKQLNSVTEGSVSVFPLFLRELFVEIVIKLNLTVIRCNFEADYEMACLARLLKCPLLSYDSDFYIFDVIYIPFSTFNMKVCKKTKSQLNYISCQTYSIERFLNFSGGFNKANLPLLAILLGNDYVNKRIFSKFYAQIKIIKRKDLQFSQQRIETLVTWLKHESYESAVKKILSRLKMNKRKFVAQQIEELTKWYVTTDSSLLKYIDNIHLYACNENKKETKALSAIKIADEVEINDESDDCSEISDDTSDSSEEEEIVDLEAITSKTSISKWFLDKYRQCKYPSCFMDIIVRNTYFCNPQVENLSSLHSHVISLPILSAIHKILTSGTSSNLIYVARNENLGLKRYELETFNKTLPTLNELELITKENSKKYLLDILNINKEHESVLNSFPESWKLYIVSTIYWILHTKEKMTKCHIYSLILCSIVLKILDPQIKCTKLNTEIRLKNKNDINFILNTCNNEKSANLAEIVNYFKIEDKMKSNIKLYDVCIVDAFAQFQSVLLHVKHLNSLLNEPFENVILSNFYNGTFLYNICTNFNKRTDLDNYVDLLLKNSTNVLNVFRNVVNKLKCFIDSENVTVYVKKRRKKKKKCKSNRDVVQEVSNQSEDSDVCNFDDENNKFSLLNFVNK